MRLRNTITILIATMLLACGGEERPIDGRGSYQRGDGKADGTASCVGQCGGQAPAGCWCDEQCAIFGDCCPDKAAACDQRPGSCEGACGGQSPAGCWCDDQCATFGDCCNDKVQQCDAPLPGKKCSSHSECAADEYCKLADGECFEPGFMYELLEGACAKKPEGCYEVWAPVCGCDSKTYGNDCEAARAGVSIGAVGECPKPDSGCYQDSDCESGQFCKLKEGECLMQTYSFAPIEGVCADKSEECAEYAQPVCGCDGKTYSNPCFADAAGVSIASQGFCQSDPPAGTDCHSDQQCKPNQFCKLATGACLSPTLDLKYGKCTTKQQACIEIYSPVCGCDGKTYDNECFAESAGVSVAALGDCPEPKPDPTGSCYSNEDCLENAYCKFEDTSCLWNTFAALEGQCHVRPDACLDIWSPVCGCDGQTYGNSCEAAAAGISLASHGECP